VPLGAQRKHLPIAFSLVNDHTHIYITYGLLSYVIERSSNIVFFFKELKNKRIDA
jgi:hypothetical protein